MNNITTFNAFLAYYQNRITAQPKRTLPLTSTPPFRLHKAMHYAVFNGGKRLRPLLVYATGKALQAPIERLDAPAIAVELIHCYSLTHDDLPAMDNDDMRRGQPTCHKAFDEATAILTGDALQSLAFTCLSDIRMTTVLAKASGSHGMAGGQDLDLASEGKTLNLTQLEQMHHLKTGALIEACVELAAIAANVNQEASTLMALRNFAKNVGLAFQIQDDILDVEGNLDALGKTPGIDTTNNKATYTRILGLTESKHRLKQQYEKAITALEALPFDTSDLAALCTYIVSRKN